MNQKTYSFPQIFNRAMRKTNLSTDDKSINECLGILLRTRPGELLGDPDYGCYLIERIFMYNGVIIESLIKEDIYNAIKKYEPRIIVSEDDIQIVKDNQVIKIFISYTIKETGEINEYNLNISSQDNPDRI